MSSGEAGSGVGGWAQPVGIPVAIIRQSGVGSSFHFNSTLPGSNVCVVLGMDVVAAHAEPIQCFVEARVDPDLSFYYDSQSTGEGNGVRFQWRGAVPVAFPGAVSVLCDSSSDIHWSCWVYGVVGPWPIPG